MNMREMLEFVADWLEDCLSCNDAEMMGISEVLEDVRNTLNIQPQMPEPNWADAPDDAMAWAVDANGYAHWFVDIPSLDVYGSEWVTHRFMEIEDAGHVILPLGVDWRTTLRCRQEEIE